MPMWEFSLFFRVGGLVTTGVMRRNGSSFCFVFGNVVFMVILSRFR